LGDFGAHCQEASLSLLLDVPQFDFGGLNFELQFAAFCLDLAHLGVDFAFLGRGLGSKLALKPLEVESLRNELRFSHRRNRAHLSLGPFL
jgi:hypothetical protein